MTLSPEQQVHIRRLFHAEHWKVGTIASELGVHPDAVKHALRTEQFASVGATARRSLLDLYKPFVTQTLEQHPRLRATRLYEMLRGRGYTGSVKQLRRYVAKVRPTSSKHAAYLLLNTLPGEQAQVDWGHFGKIDVKGGQRLLSCFVIGLRYSRAMYARFTLDQRMDSFLRAHQEGFRSFDGVPRQILYDNPRSVVLQRVGQHIQYHPALLELAGHYHFQPKACAPYQPHEKGLVERLIQYLRGSFFEARKFVDIDDLNAQLSKWIANTAHQRPHPTDEARRLVVECFEQERARLLPLPEHPANTDHVQPIRSGKQPYVRFDGNHYSIPHTLVRKPLTLTASERQVRIIDGNVVAATHQRSYDRRQVIEQPAHLEALAAEKRRASELRGRDKLRVLCPHADALLDALARRNEPLRQRTNRLLQLLQRYGAEALDEAIAEALQGGTPAVGAIAYILETKRKRAGAPVPVDMPLSPQARSKDVVVVPHDLADYDQLGGSEATTDDDEGQS